MDKKIKDHKKYIVQRIKELKAKPDKIEIRDVLTYHQQMIENFQHERLVHLVIMLFFATLFIASFGASLALQMSNMLAGDVWSVFVDISVRVIGLILFVTTLFYIRHYYRLENGIEKLYDQSVELERIRAES